MTAHQHEQGPRPEHVANWSADTLDVGFGDGMGLAMRMLGEAAALLMSTQVNDRRVKLLGENVFDDDFMGPPPVIGG
ncbi:hypothetical protein [Lentzea sp. NPDC059081]|uniref:hypothetical protein n=1 Tax=Lentzea sp. NPDC059081 TaxID=3346719 RepID=UPI003678EBFC